MESRTDQSMPGKLKLLVGLCVVSAIWDGLSADSVGMLVSVVYVVGVLRGNELVTKVIIGLAYVVIGMTVLGIPLLVLAHLTGTAVAEFNIAEFSSGDVNLSNLDVGVVSAELLLTVLSLVPVCFVVWCLRQPDVQRWKFGKVRPGIY